MVMSTVGSMGFNPYVNQFSTGMGMNGDFMANAMFETQNYGIDPTAFAGYGQAYNQGQPASDTYQSSGRSGLGTGLKLGAVAGVGTTAGMYFLGGDKVSPFVDGKFDDKLLRSLEDPNVAAKKALEMKNIKINEIVKSKLGFPNDIALAEEQYKAIAEVAKGKEWPAHVVKPTELAGLDEAQAKAIVEDVNKIDSQKLLEQAAKEHTLDGSTKHLSELNARKAKLTALESNISTEELAKHLKDNAKLYGITGADEAAIKAAADAEAAKGLQTLINENAAAITAQDGRVSTIRSALDGKIRPHWDQAGKKLFDGAPENIQKAVKSFKFNKAGKFGLIAAVAGLVLGWMFGGNK